MFTVSGNDEYITALGRVNSLLESNENNVLRTKYMNELTDLRVILTKNNTSIQTDLVKYRGILENITKYDGFGKKFVYMDNKNALYELNQALDKPGEFLDAQFLLIGDIEKLNSDVELLHKYNDISNGTKSNIVQEDRNKLEYEINERKKLLKMDVLVLDHGYSPMPDIQFTLDNNNSFMVFVIILIVLFITTVAAIAKFISYRKNKKIQNDQEKKSRLFSELNPIIF